ncbi:hypothetical protein OOK41_13855 [Micromonospora sp. NBC_01655]|uniref:hypothetical protein n=1 Tax=Micromonospora sp. NBC_01655 TaxID=2975983 RepID=UPI002255E93E|nr:hypothetical protein [Micromonospora sp. NBC_01655]MCX4471380.1 hypothetical protein [Micromonospora sp. NBC_01655]
MLTRRTVIAVTGAALTAPAWSALHQPAPDLVSAARKGGPVSSPLLDMIDTVVAHAQQLDDHRGGAARDFVSDQFTAVERLLRRAPYTAAAGRRLAAALAQLAQTAGFMASTPTKTASHNAGTSPPSAPRARPPIPASPPASWPEPG